MYSSRLDDKGRLKVPVDFQRYIASLSEETLFVTSLDRRTAQIYPMSTWLSNEIFFQNYRANPRLARNVAFNANDLGANAVMDAQGRIQFPPDLRRELGLENNPLKLYCYRGHIEVLSEKVYLERKQEASEGSVDNVLALEQDGLL